MALMKNSMVAHKDQCIGCGDVFDNEELHTVEENGKHYPMCSPCIETKAEEIYANILDADVPVDMAYERRFSRNNR